MNPHPFVADKGRGFVFGPNSMTVAADIREVVISTYPFFASDERAKAIRDNYQRVAVGMALEEVAAIIGAPDEIRTLYEPKMKRAKVIGYTHWYLIRRLVKSGSVNDQQEALVRVSYGLDDRVMRVDAWGF
jgi:hypothetical protein